MHAGIIDWLTAKGLLYHYDVNMYSNPLDWGFISEEVLRSQDVILLIGFYLAPGGDPAECCRLGGHYVTVAGVDAGAGKIAISDPSLDVNNPIPVDHNDAANVSHDIYDVLVMDHQLCEPLSGGLFMPDYPAETQWDAYYRQNGDATCADIITGPVFAILEYAEIICPNEDCEGQLPGDADNDGDIDIDDIVYLTTFIHGGGPAPNPLANGDPNGDCKINNGDILYLTLFLNSGGSPPVECTCVDPALGICCYGMTGNIDYDPLDIQDIDDLVYFVEYQFGQPVAGPAPPCLEEANTDGIEGIDIADLVLMVDYQFNQGPAPVQCPTK